MICIIGQDGLVHFHTRNGAFNAMALCNFLDDALPKIPKDSTIVMDNAVIHRSRDVTQKYGTYGLKHKFLPRYSPQLNPIENFFSVVKAHQKRVRPRPRTREALEESTLSVLDKLKHFDCKGLYRRMRDFVLIGIEGQEFP